MSNASVVAFSGRPPRTNVLPYRPVPVYVSIPDGEFGTLGTVLLWGCAAFLSIALHIGAGYAVLF